MKIIKFLTKRRWRVRKTDTGDYILQHTVFCPFIWVYFPTCCFSPDIKPLPIYNLRRYYGKFAFNTEQDAIKSAEYIEERLKKDLEEKRANRKFKKNIEM